MYQNFISKMETILEKLIDHNHSLVPYLQFELTQMQNALNNLKPHRVGRSLNFIGSAWKWVAGNPDHDDFELIKNKMNNVLENNNKQVIINQLQNERINNITKITNDILTAMKNDNVINYKILLNLQYKIKLAKEELINIGYAIHWAKSGIINSVMLAKSEIELATDTLDRENLPYANPEEA